MKNLHFSLLSTLLVAVFACGAPWVNYPSEGTVEKVGISPETLYAASVRVFVKRGYGLVNRDPAARVVETDYIRWREVVGSGGSVVHVAYRVLVDGDGTVHVFTSCRRAFGQECPSGQRPKGVSEVERELIQAIFKESASVGR